MPIVRQLLVGLRVLIALTVILGVVYPLVLTGVGRLLSHRADGSLVERSGRPVGSSLIGQNFTGSGWFHPRPSASGYDAMVSGGTNLGPDSPVLLGRVRRERVAIASTDKVGLTHVPPDAVTSSGSGLDPDISPAYAYQQAERVALARRLDPRVVRRLVADQVSGRQLGFLGEPHVNVLLLNLALLRAVRTTP